MLLLSVHLLLVAIAIYRKRHLKCYTKKHPLFAISLLLLLLHSYTRLKLVFSCAWHTSMIENTKSLTTCKQAAGCSLAQPYQCLRADLQNQSWHSFRTEEKRLLRYYRLCSIFRWGPACSSLVTIFFFMPYMVKDLSPYTWIYPVTYSLRVPNAFCLLWKSLWCVSTVKLWWETHKENASLLTPNTFLLFSGGNECFTYLCYKM